jgi:hypothetical protein
MQRNKSKNNCYEEMQFMVISVNSKLILILMKTILLQGEAGRPGPIGGPGTGGPKVRRKR